MIRVHAREMAALRAVAAAAVKWRNSESEAVAVALAKALDRYQRTMAALQSSSTDSEPKR